MKTKSYSQRCSSLFELHPRAPHPFIDYLGKGAAQTNLSSIQHSVIYQSLRRMIN
jgi:hypothetical protein